MQLITCHDGKLQTLSQLEVESRGGRSFSTGLAAVDGLLPRGRLRRGAVHEVLYEGSESAPVMFPLLLGMGSCKFQIPNSKLQTKAESQISDFKSQISDFGESQWLILSDPQRRVYPPALAGLGVPLERVLLLYPESAGDEMWAVTECLRCGGVGAVVASPARVSKIEARRLQLAAEQGGGVGVLVRARGRGSLHHAAVTRWLVRPSPGDRTIHRWRVELIHGHGGRIGEAVTLEYCRETHSVRASEAMADRSVAPEVGRIPA